MRFLYASLRVLYLKWKSRTTENSVTMKRINTPGKEKKEYFFYLAKSLIPLKSGISPRLNPCP